MDQAVADRFEEVLEEVKDPESNLPVARLGVVTRFRYNEEQRTIYVFTGYGSHRPGCLTCAGVSAAIEHGINRRLGEALEQRFPGFSIEFIPDEE
jgi:metal-sulfur cluster biosynthetic enzyme